METGKEVNIQEINYMLNIYGQVVATPGTSQENIDMANKNIHILLDLLEPVVSELKMKYSKFTL